MNSCAKLKSTELPEPVTALPLLLSALQALSEDDILPRSKYLQLSVLF